MIERTTALAGASHEISVRALQQAAVASLGQSALSNGDLTGLMNAAANLVADTLKVEFTGVLEYLREKNELRLRGAVGWSPDFIDTYAVPADDTTPAGYALLVREPVLVGDAQRETRFPLTPHLIADGIRSAVLLTIGGKLSPFGVLGAYTTRERDFTTDDVHFLQTVANVLAAAIERKRAEEAIQQSQQAAERANAAKSEFLSRMSHELRTPLNAILGFGQLLEMDPLDAQQQQGVTYILKAGRHLLHLIDEILDISRIEAGRLDLAMGPVVIDKLLSEVVALVRPLADHRQIRIDQPGSDDACHRLVLADEKRLRQVLLNLLSNAVKYNSEGGQVQIGCETAGMETKRLRIAISDTGPGIAPEKLCQLFSPFERLGAEQTGIEGSGLGLALSKRLIEAQGGTIEAASQMGEGSTFTVTLPMAVLPNESPMSAFPTTPEALEMLSPDCGETLVDTAGETVNTVLYIEDNLSNLNLVENLLSREPNIQLLAAIRGGIGLEMAVQHRPDLILLDLHLPDISGQEVLRRLQRHPATERIPVVVISADATPAQINTLLAAGACDYLTKPLDLKRFLQVLHRCLHAAEGALAESAA